MGKKGGRKAPMTIFLLTHIKKFYRCWVLACIHSHQNVYIRCDHVRMMWEKGVLIGHGIKTIDKNIHNYKETVLSRVA